ncbi:MAG: fructosamine kinase family protein [Pseudomonadota bacterium]
MSDWPAIAAQIALHSGEPFDPRPPRSQGGGCINRAVVLDDGRRRFFVKLNDAALLDMFEAEADGLSELVSAQAIRVPEPLCTGVAQGESFIVMEHLSLGRPAADSQSAAGEGLARLHARKTQAFGWHRDNTIGSTPQHNGWSDDWIAFWRDKRLGFQLKLAARNGYNGRLQRLGERLLEGFPVLLDHDPPPSLLHGDLWGGNMSYDDHGEPVIFDPAVYYGDREADLAMTELFGGFGGEFYTAYQNAWPLDAGYATRRTLYNLYHVLNHLNLFGGGYGAQAVNMMERLLAEI